MTFLTLSCGHHSHHHSFSDAEKWAKVFENNKRDTWQRPKAVFEALGIKKDSVIADIGSATGYFPVRLTKVATEGRVWGIDIEPNLVRFLNKRARTEKIDNLFSVLSPTNEALIPESVDFVFVVNTYHHIGHRKDYFKKLQVYLKKNAQLVIIDFKKKPLPFGPSVKMKISKEEIVRELADANYQLNKDHAILEYQNVLVFTVK